MLLTLWDSVKGLFSKGGSTLIGANQKSFSCTATANDGGVAVNAKNVYIHGSPQPSFNPATDEKTKLLSWLHENAYKEPPSHSLPHLIRLAHVVGNNEVERWARMEMIGWTQEGGMTEQDKVPEYRGVVGRYINDFGQMLQTPEGLEELNSDRFRFGVATIENFAKQTDMQNIANPGFLDLIKQNLKFNAVRFCFSPIAAADVVNAIRNQIFDKIRELEKA